MIRTSRCAWRATRCSTWSKRSLWASAVSGTPAWTPTRFCQNPPSTSTTSWTPSARACRQGNTRRLKRCPRPDQTRPVHVRQDHQNQMWAGKLQKKKEKQHSVLSSYLTCTDSCFLLSAIFIFCAKLPAIIQVFAIFPAWLLESVPIIWVGRTTKLFQLLLKRNLIRTTKSKLNVLRKIGTFIQFQGVINLWNLTADFPWLKLGCFACPLAWHRPSSLVWSWSSGALSVSPWPE